MSLRYLFGPIDAEFANQKLAGPRQSGQCLTFGRAGTDLVLRPNDTWQEICARLPSVWQPDFIALYHDYATIPAGLWSATVPVIGLATDWNLLWHVYRHSLRRCDLVFTD